MKQNDRVYRNPLSLENGMRILITLNLSVWGFISTLPFHDKSTRIFISVFSIVENIVLVFAAHFLKKWEKVPKKKKGRLYKILSEISGGLAFIWYILGSSLEIHVIFIYLMVFSLFIMLLFTFLYIRST